MAFRSPVLRQANTKRDVSLAEAAGCAPPDTDQRGACGKGDATLRFVVRLQTVGELHGDGHRFRQASERPTVAAHIGSDPEARVPHRLARQRLGGEFTRRRRRGPRYRSARQAVSPISICEEPRGARNCGSRCPTMAWFRAVRCERPPGQVQRRCASACLPPRRVRRYEGDVAVHYEAARHESIWANPGSSCRTRGSMLRDVLGDRLLVKAAIDATTRI